MQEEQQGTRKKLRIRQKGISRKFAGKVCKNIQKTTQEKIKEQFKKACKKEGGTMQERMQKVAEYQARESAKNIGYLQFQNDFAAAQTCQSQ